MTHGAPGKPVRPPGTMATQESGGKRATVDALGVPGAIGVLADGAGAETQGHTSKIFEVERTRPPRVHIFGHIHEDYGKHNYHLIEAENLINLFF